MMKGLIFLLCIYLFILAKPSMRNIIVYFFVSLPLSICCFLGLVSFLIFLFFWVEFKSPVLASLAALSFLEKLKCHFFLLFIIIVSFAKSACSMMSRVLGFIL